MKPFAISFVKFIRRSSYRRCRKGVVTLMQRGRLLHVHTEEETFVTGVYLGTWAPWARGVRNVVCIIAYFAASLFLSRKRAHLLPLLPARRGGLSG